MRKRNIMIGPSPEAKGGISAVIAQYRDNDFFSALDIIYLPTHAPGGIVKKSSTTIFSFVKMLALLSVGKANLVHIHTASYRSFYRKSLFAWLAYLFCRPVIFHIHGGKFISFAQSLAPNRRQFLLRTLNKTKYIIVLSEVAARQLCDELGLPRNKIEVLANPIAISRRPERPSEPTQRLLFLGDIKKEKGVYDLIDALAMLQTTHTQIALFCGGLGETDELRVYAHAMGVSCRLHILGWVNTKQKENQLTLADIFVLPSYAEGQPMTILEAMAAGVPIVASDVGGIPEMLHDGTLGFLVPPGDIKQLADAIAYVLKEPNQSKTKANQALDAVTAQYAPQIVCLELARVYRAIA